MDFVAVGGGKRLDVPLRVVCFFVAVLHAVAVGRGLPGVRPGASGLRIVCVGRAAYAARVAGGVGRQGEHEISGFAKSPCSACRRFSEVVRWSYLVISPSPT